MEPRSTTSALEVAVQVHRKVHALQEASFADFQQLRLLRGTHLDTHISHSASSGDVRAHMHHWHTVADGGPSYRCASPRQSCSQNGRQHWAQPSPGALSTTAASSVTRCSSAPHRFKSDTTWVTPARAACSSSMSAPDGPSSPWQNTPSTMLMASPQSAQCDEQQPVKTPRRWSKARERAVQSWNARQPGCSAARAGQNASLRMQEDTPQDLPRIFARLAQDEECQSRFFAPWLFEGAGQLRSDLQTPLPSSRHQHGLWHGPGWQRYSGTPQVPSRTSIATPQCT